MRAALHAGILAPLVDWVGCSAIELKLDEVHLFGIYFEQSLLQSFLGIRHVLDLRVDLGGQFRTHVLYFVHPSLRHRDLLLLSAKGLQALIASSKVCLRFRFLVFKHGLLGLRIQFGFLAAVLLNQRNAGQQFGFWSPSLIGVRLHANMVHFALGRFNLLGHYR